MSLHTGKLLTTLVVKSRRKERKEYRWKKALKGSSEMLIIKEKSWIQFDSIFSYCTHNLCEMRRFDVEGIFAELVFFRTRISLRTVSVGCLDPSD